MFSGINHLDKIGRERGERGADMEEGFHHQCAEGVGVDFLRLMAYLMAI